jgi:uncharacterized protein (DUF1330 family)
VAAYWFAFVKVRNPEQYAKYADRASDILAGSNARVLSRGGSYHVMEGFADYNRFVLVEWPSMEEALENFHNPTYQEAAGFRRDGGGDAEIAVVDGVEGVTAEHAPGQAYYVARISITDDVQYQRYLDGTAPLYAAAPVRTLTRGGTQQILEGPMHFNRYVASEFPSAEEAITYYNNPAYQASAEYRRNGGGTAEIVVLDS